MNTGLQILHEDNHLIAVNKPAGWLVQGDDTGDKPLSEFVKGKMVDGKIPLRFSHYVSYLEKHWQQQIRIRKRIIRRNFIISREKWLLLTK